MAATWVELFEDAIDMTRVRGFVVGDEALGGIVSFEGVTRGESDPAHGPLRCLRYEAHPSMAKQQMQILADQAATRFGAGRVVIVHRVGKVAPGEASVAIAVGCAHRVDAFDACRWIIDTLKKDVPIWKQDVFEDGFESWVEVRRPNGE